MSKSSADNFCELIGIRKALMDAAVHTYAPPPRTTPDFVAGLRIPQSEEQERAQEQIISTRYLRSLIAYRREFFCRASIHLMPVVEKDRIDPSLYGQACALVDIFRETWEQPTPQVCFGPSPDWALDRFRRPAYITFMKAYGSTFDLFAPTLRQPLIGMLPRPDVKEVEHAA